MIDDLPRVEPMRKVKERDRSWEMRKVRVKKKALYHRRVQRMMDLRR